MNISVIIIPNVKEPLNMNQTLPGFSFNYSLMSRQSTN